ncbi:hypothetical protein VKT23_010575 [Stygiomarasmius scandens]|uniref:Uncharacterized protein n=1 Tax=Marasmiellus scandens TaxID=2682957 RepID=A0ABR1JAL3_9AGAR
MNFLKHASSILQQDLPRLHFLRNCHLLRPRMHLLSHLSTWTILYWISLLSTITTVVVSSDECLTLNIWMRNAASAKTAMTDASSTHTGTYIIPPAFVCSIPLTPKSGPTMPTST